MIDTARPPIPALTGLRFFAALSILLNHLWPVFLNVAGGAPQQEKFQRLALIGMSLFFCLSGFIIHYNYGQAVSRLSRSGLYDFFVARFTRLYPLYFCLLLFDLTCSNILIASDEANLHKLISALPFYVLAVQSWFFKTFGIHPLTFAYRYTFVTWSISTEFFLYAIYPIIAVSLRPITRPVTGFIGFILVFLASILLVAGMRAHYADIDLWAQRVFGIVLPPRTSPPTEFADWLAYVSPYGRLPEFLTGCLAAHLHLVLRDRRPGPTEQVFGVCVMVLALGYIGLAMSSTLMRLTPHSDLIYWAGMFPAMPILIFGCSRYGNFFTNFVSHPTFIQLGDASYSMYMLHIFFIEATAVIPGVPLTPANAVILGIRVFVVTGMIFIASLGFYRYFEVPARRWLRSVMLPNHKPHRSSITVPEPSALPV